MEGTDFERFCYDPTAEGFTTGVHVLNTAMIGLLALRPDIALWLPGQLR